MAGKYDTPEMEREIRCNRKVVKVVGFYRGYVRTADAVSSQMHRSTVTPKELSWMFCISEKSAEKSLLGTTQHAKRVEVDNLMRRF